MNISNISDFFKDMTVVYLTVNTWTAKRKLSEKELGLKPGQFSAEVANLGSKTVFDKEKVKRLRNIKNEGEAFLSSVGYNCLGGWAVPRQKLDEIQEKLIELQERYYLTKEDIINSYEVDLDNYAEFAELKMPGFGNVVRQAAYSVDYLENTLHFNTRYMEDELESPSDGLLEEIAREANNILETMDYSSSRASGKPRQFTRRAFRPLHTIKDKLNGMTFLDSCIRPVVDRLSQFLDSIPERGKLEQEWLFQLVSELTFLSDAENMRRYRSLQNSEILDDDESEGESAPQEAESQLEDEFSDFMEIMATSYDDDEPKKQDEVKPSSAFF